MMASVLISPRADPLSKRTTLGHSQHVIYKVLTLTSPVVSLWSFSQATLQLIFVKQRHGH